MSDNSNWITAHYLKLSLNKTKLLPVPGKDCSHMDLLVLFKDIAGEKRNLVWYWTISYAAQQTSTR